MARELHRLGIAICPDDQAAVYRHNVKKQVQQEQKLEEKRKQQAEKEQEKVKLQKQALYSDYRSCFASNNNNDFEKLKESRGDAIPENFFSKYGFSRESREQQRRDPELDYKSRIEKLIE